MDYPKIVKAMLEKFGQSVKIEKQDGTEFSCCAVMMPLLYKNKLYVELQPSTVGKIDEGCYRFLGPEDAVFEPDDIVSFEGKSYVTQRFERIYFCGKPFYTWAILRPCISKEATI